MKKSFLLMCLMTLSYLLCAQERMDRELQSLVNAVCALRKADEVSYNQVKDSLARDYAWTPMNETGPLQNTECAYSATIPRFKLNRMLTLIAGERKYVDTKGDMLNGTDERYNYSLYERSVQAGKSASYRLDGREGVQWFVLVPYDANSGISASLSIEGGEPVTFTPADSGILTARMDHLPVNGSPTLVLTVTGGPKPQSFVILNYNSRKE